MSDIDALRKALEHSPDNVALLALLAEKYVEQFRLDDARQQYEKILQIDPQSEEITLHLIELYNLAGQTSQAIVRLEDYCQRHPRSAAAWALLARFELEEENFEAAARAYQKAVALDPALTEDEQLAPLHSAPEAAAQPLPIASGGESEPWDGEDARDEEPDFAEIEFEKRPDIQFNQVGGMEAVKEEIKMKILYPLQNPSLFQAYGKKAGGGVLLYGPPGCGKTLISRATAGELEAPFLSIGLHQVLDMWMGKSEEKLHQIFQWARENSPAVLFFDEIDALAADRRDLRTSAGRTLINQFLAELDGHSGENDQLLIMGATNAPWHIDGAFLRPGRFDRILFVPPPDEAAREEILGIHAEGKPLEKFAPRELARKTANFSGADLKAVFDQAVESALQKAMAAGKVIPVSQKLLLQTAKSMRPSTAKWFENAKNYALYSNEGGLYDDILHYLKIKK